MTPAMLELFTGFRDRLNELGQPMLHRDTAIEFRAILLPVPPIDGGNELGEDIREMATLECRRDQCPPIRKYDLIEQIRPHWRTAAIAASFPNPVWKAVRREDNTVSFAIKFWMVKITDSDGF
jgi:hypothetical protein